MSGTLKEGGHVNPHHPRDVSTLEAQVATTAVAHTQPIRGKSFDLGPDKTSFVGIDAVTVTPHDEHGVAIVHAGNVHNHKDNSHLHDAGLEDHQHKRARVHHEHGRSTDVDLTEIGDALVPLDTLEHSSLPVVSNSAVNNGMVPLKNLERGDISSAGRTTLVEKLIARGTTTAAEQHAPKGHAGHAVTGKDRTMARGADE